jgi:hypothetical protein
MRVRSITAVAAAAALSLAACGGDGGGNTLSEDELVDELTDICDDASSDLDRLDLPTDGDFESFAGDAQRIFEDTIERVRALRPPEAVARDLADFLANLEDQLNELEDLAGATSDDEAGRFFEELDQLSDEQSEIAQDLGVEACDPNAGGGSDDTAAPAPTAVTTAPPTTVAATLPATTAAPATLPPTVPPTAAPATQPPPAVGGFEIVDLTTDFVAPDGFFLVSGTPDQATIDAIGALPELNEKLLQIGVVTLFDADTDLEIADIWLGLSRTDAMPAAWKDLDCPIGDLRSSANGILGIVCAAPFDSPFFEVFTATDADVGISVYTRIPDVTGDLVADAFFEANF